MVHFYVKLGHVDKWILPSFFNFIYFWKSYLQWFKPIKIIFENIYLFYPLQPSLPLKVPLIILSFLLRFLNLLEYLFFLNNLLNSNIFTPLDPKCVRWLMMVDFYRTLEVLHLLFENLFGVIADDVSTDYLLLSIVAQVHVLSYLLLQSEIGATVWGYHFLNVGLDWVVEAEGPRKTVLGEVSRDKYFLSIFNFFYEKLFG